jgi:hypothetical protein
MSILLHFRRPLDSSYKWVSEIRMRSEFVDGVEQRRLNPGGRVWWKISSTRVQVFAQSFTSAGASA